MNNSLLFDLQNNKYYDNQLVPIFTNISETTHLKSNAAAGISWTKRFRNTTWVYDRSFLW